MTISPWLTFEKLKELDSFASVNPSIEIPSDQTLNLYLYTSGDGSDGLTPETAYNDLEVLMTDLITKYRIDGEIIVNGEPGGLFDDFVSRENLSFKGGGRIRFKTDNDDPSQTYFRWREFTANSSIKIFLDNIIFRVVFGAFEGFNELRIEDCTADDDFQVYHIQGPVDIERTVFAGFETIINYCAQIRILNPEFTDNNTRVKIFGGRVQQVGDLIIPDLDNENRLIYNGCFISTSSTYDIIAPTSANFSTAYAIEYNNCIISQDVPGQAATLTNVTGTPILLNNCIFVDNPPEDFYADNNAMEVIPNSRGTYANDTAAASAGLLLGEVYTETSTGYLKVRTV